MNLLKLLINGLLATAIISLASTGSVNADFQTVAGSKHDLSTNPAIQGDVGVCAYCHVVDNESGVVSAALNRSDPVSNLTLYDSEALQTEISGMAPVSLHCMSCHDGETPFDALGNFEGTENNNMSTVFPDSTAITGVDLNAHHPVGVINLEDNYFEEPSAIATSGLPNYDNKIECPTCHEVHGKSGFGKFLRKSNENSSLCLSCHIK